jgi:hypothetical protein
MEKQLRIFKKDEVWSAELWCEYEEPFISGMYFEDKVTAIDFQTLLVEIGNKNWIDLLNK